jgi:hypothetical protein
MFIGFDWGKQTILLIFIGLSMLLFFLGGLPCLPCSKLTVCYGKWTIEIDDLSQT